MTIRTLVGSCRKRASAMYIAATVICSAALAAAAFGQEWLVRYRPPGAYCAGASRLASDGNGGVVASGYAYRDSTHGDFLTARLDAHGGLLWQASYDYARHDDQPTAMAVAPDGRVVVCGKSDWGDYGYDFAIVSYRANGEQAWVTRWRPPGVDKWNHPTAMVMDAAGNVAVTGYATFIDTTIMWYNFATVFVDTAGEVRWAARCTGSWIPKAIALDSAGCVYVGGSRDGHGNGYLVVKYAPDGTERWRLELPDVEPLKLAVGSDGSILAGGIAHGSTRRSDDYWVARLDTTGVLRWQSSYNGPGDGDDWIFDMKTDKQSNTYVTGMSPGAGTSNDICTASWDSAGNQRWVARFDGGLSGSDIGFGLCVDSASCYVAGRAYVSSPDETDACLLKYSADHGTFAWAKTYDGPAASADYYSGVVSSPQSGLVYASGQSMFDDSLRWRDCVIACYRTEITGAEETARGVETTFPSARIVRRLLVLAGRHDSELLDTSGRKVMALQPGTNDIGKLAPGMYFMRAVAPGDCEEKIIVTR
jgi:hypothetical protein